MAEKSRSWSGISVRAKMAVWCAVLLLTITLAGGTTITIGRRMLAGFDQALRDHTICYEVQEAIAEEREAFQSYVRGASQENQNRYEQACRAARAHLAALPFDYAQTGEERYARTWNLVQGYEGYAVHRDAFLRMDPEQGGYIEEFYRVMEMQEYLLAYALRLVEATLDHSADAYARQASRFALTRRLFSGLLVLALVAVVLILRAVAVTLCRPLLQMARESRRIAENDFSGAELTVRSHDEVGELVRAFNRMKCAMQEHISTLEEKNRIASALHQEALLKIELEKNLENTRLEVLKSQVNPHFLFNTLNLISCMARLEEAGTTDRMILSLSNLFGYNLRTKAQEVYLEQELEALDDYLYLQQMRFGSRITCRKQILVDPQAVRLPSFSLQPVVENAFVHGLSAKEEDGRILLRVWQQGNLLRVSVVDNGKGMTPAEYEALLQKAEDSERTGRGIGLGNLKKRIEILYQGGSFEVYSRPGHGTAVQLAIPQQGGAQKEG